MSGEAAKDQANDNALPINSKKRKDRMQEDFSPIVEAELPKQIQLAKEGKLQQALENLYALEKQTRQAEDYPSTSKLAVAIVKLCYESKDWNLLNQNLQILSKRRGQLRSVSIFHSSIIINAYTK